MPTAAPSIFGGLGGDTIKVSYGIYTIDAGGNNDLIGARSSTANIEGGTGDDTIRASFGTYTLDGGQGNDSISLEFGTSTVTGGTGDDTIYVKGFSGDSDLVKGNQGSDLMSADLFPGYSATLRGGQGDDTLTVQQHGFGTTDSNAVLKGGAGSDHFIVSYHASTADAQVDNASHDTLVTIADLGKLPTGDVLTFHASENGPITQASLNSVATVSDNGTDVKIVIPTSSTGAEHLTVVLNGIGGHSIDSIDDIINQGYNLTFT